MHRPYRLFFVACALLPTLGIVACVRAFPKTEGTLEIKAQHRDGRVVTARGPITWGGLLGCEDENLSASSIELSIGSKESATIRASQGSMQLLVEAPLLGVDDNEAFLSFDPVYSVVATPLAEGRFRYFATMMANDHPNPNSDFPPDPIERVSARAVFTTTPAKGRGAYWISYTLCN